MKENKVIIGLTATALFATCSFLIKLSKRNEKRRQKNSPIVDIRNEFFGNKKNQDYLKDYFVRSVRDVIQYEVLNAEFNKQFTDQTPQALWVPFWHLITVFQKGMMVNFRRLVKDENCSGKSFVQKILLLTEDDLYDYYFQPDRTQTPSYFTLSATDLDGAVQVEQIRVKNANAIREHLKVVQDKARVIRDHNYPKISGLLKYEQYEIHGDRSPEKYEIEERNIGTDEEPVIQNWIFLKAQIDTDLIGEYLEQLGMLITDYTNLGLGGRYPFGTNPTLPVYVYTVSNYFSQPLTSEEQIKVIEIIEKKLGVAIRAAGFKSS